jgi:integrase
MLKLYGVTYMKEVEAVKTKEEIMMVERLLRTHHGDLYADIWRIGVNLSLRISDLLAIRFADLNLVNHLYTLVEGKTKKVRHVRLNPTALSLIRKRREQYPDDIYLFQVHSNRTAGFVKPVSRVSVARVFKDIGDRIGIHIGTHSMRKSRGWAMHSDGVPIEKISKVLNHATPAVTMAYLGISKADILNTYLEYEL